MTNNISFHPAFKTDTNVPATLDFASDFIPQIQKILESAGSGMINADEITLSGQAVAAILMLSGLEMLRGLPKMTLFKFGEKIERTGVLNTADYRHKVVRNRRGEIPQGAAFAGYTVLDGTGRGLTAIQRKELAKLLRTRQNRIRVLDVNVGQVDFEKDPTAGMVDKLLNCGMTIADWAARKFFYLPAGSGLAAALQATTIHGLSESWPRTIRLNKLADGEFHIQEVVDPQDMRQWGAELRGSWESDQTAAVLAEIAASASITSVKAEGNTLVVTNFDGRTFRVAVSSVEEVK